MSFNNFARFVEKGKKIAGAGLNYKSLIKERNLPVPLTPVIFLKPTSSYITEGNAIELPRNSEVHEEVELGVIIGKKCKNISENNALEYIGGYCLALDLTDVIQMKESRSKGLPWTFGKGFDTACPVSRFIPRDEISDVGNIHLWCRVNGEIRQDDSTAGMIFTVPSLISYVSQFMSLEPNDLILTGSPAGTSRISPGDTIDCGLGSILTMKFHVKCM